MATKVNAIYTNGVFRPATPVPVADGTEVELIVKLGDRTPLADLLGEIARLPAEGPQDGFSGADHDTVLYREPDTE